MKIETFKIQRQIMQTAQGLNGFYIIFHARVDMQDNLGTMTCRINITGTAGGALNIVTNDPQEMPPDSVLGTVCEWYREYQIMDTATLRDGDDDRVANIIPLFTKWVNNSATNTVQGGVMSIRGRFGRPNTNMYKTYDEPDFEFTANMNDPTAIFGNYDFYSFVNDSGNAALIQNYHKNQPAGGSKTYVQPPKPTNPPNDSFLFRYPFVYNDTETGEEQTIYYYYGAALTTT